MAKVGSLEYHLAVFKKIVIDLKTLEVKYDEEDLTLIMLCSLLALNSSFRNRILYGRDILTIDDVYDALFSNEKLKHLVGVASRNEEILVSHGHRWRGCSRVKFSNQYCLYCMRK